VKILILNYEYPPLGGGGGRLAARVGAGLVSRGHQVRVLTAGMAQLPKMSVEEGMEISRLRAFRRREDTCSVPEMALWAATAIPAALVEIHRWKPDVIHAHFAVPTGVVALVAHQVTGVPYVLTAHLGDVPGGVPEQTGNLFRWIKPLTVPIWKSATAVTAVSSFVSGLASKAYDLSPQVILNGITLPPPPMLEIRQPARLLMVGRMSVQKNPLLAIRALGLLREIRWNCTILGDGPLLAEARVEAELLGLADRINFTGWTSAAEVSRVMQDSDILLMPSLSEGLPMVAIEALTHGMALVGSRIGGLSDVAQESGVTANARLFDLSEGAEAMAAALKPYITDPISLLAARHASLALTSRFDLENSLDAYESVLKRVCR
jgi:glycosyltransferase involved in cell wall biosynthesis